MTAVKSKTATPTPEASATTKALTPEASAIEQNEQNKLKLVATEDRAELLLSAAEQAELDRDAIEDSFKAGDEKTYTALDHAVAGSAVIRAEALAAFAASAVIKAVSYTHLRAHETDSYLVC